MRKVLKGTQSHQPLAPEGPQGLEINVADAIEIELDLDALEEMTESIGEEVGERTEALAEELHERWGVYKRLVEASPNPHKQSILVPYARTR
ncbi:MAG: hypothetical protein IIA55_01895 [Gemmatimonadetes bacterium]|nr:hypothetical protein [Gemmatimonadota bacterium]